MTNLEDVTGRYAQVRGTRTYFETSGTGTPIVCVHTAGCDGRVFRYLVPILVQAGYQAIALDLPGHGKSYPLNWKHTDSLHEYAEFVMDFIKALDLDRPVIIGCSIGGDITIDLAVNHSDELRACIALEGAGRTPTYGNVSRFVPNHAAVGWEAIAEMGAPSTFHTGAPVHLLDEIRWLQKSAAQTVRAADLVGWNAHNVVDRLATVTVPLLVGVGSCDYQVPVQFVDETVARAPTAKKVVLDNLGHYPMFEDAPAVAKVILGFFASNGIA